MPTTRPLSSTTGIPLTRLVNISPAASWAVVSGRTVITWQVMTSSTVTIDLPRRPTLCRETAPAHESNCYAVRGGTNGADRLREMAGRGERAGRRTDNGASLGPGQFRDPSLR